MVEENFKKGEADRKAWEENNMLGRISETEEYKAAGLFLLSRASSYMVGGIPTPEERHQKLTTNRLARI
jgi:hypothetical protein